MDHRPASPSARFYAHRSTPNTPQMNPQVQTTIGPASPRAHDIELFGHFQGFSSLSTPHEQFQPRFGVYGYHIPDGDISPRMLIPNPDAWDSPRTRVQTLADGHASNFCQSRIYQPRGDLDSKSNIDEVLGQYEAAFSQRSPSCQCNIMNQPTPPYMYTNNHVKPFDHLQGQCHGGTSSPPMSFVATRHPNSFVVPSDSDSGHLSGNLDSPPYDALPDISEAEEDSFSFPSSTLGAGLGAGAGASTIYPEDSVSTASRAAAPHSITPLAARRTLADDVMGIHDICLAATQRYLEGLRVNWDLRNGRPVGGAAAHSLKEGGQGQQQQHHDRGRGDRWSPYAADVGSRRRTRSESHLAHMAILGGGSSSRSHGRGKQRADGAGYLDQTACLAPTNPIPSVTNSLLHNIRSICELIWRRAQRDREDVLGAEARGCRAMSFLHNCGERIVLYSAADAEGDPEQCLHRVVAAGTGICRELKDWEGLRLMRDGEVVQDGQEEARCGECGG